MIVRTSNFERRNSTEYFIVDRQYRIGADRFDLSGIFWDRNRRRRNQESNRNWNWARTINLQTA